MIPADVKYRDVIGKRVMFDRDFMSDQGIGIKRGTKGRVRLYATGGFTVETEKCPCCGSWANVKRVKKEDITIIEGE